MGFHLTREKSGPRKIGFLNLQAFSWRSVNPTHCHPKLSAERSNIYRKDNDVLYLRFYRSSKIDPCFQPEISDQTVSPWTPHVELANFAELDFSMGNLHFENHYQKLPYEVVWGPLVITCLLLYQGLL